MSCGKMKLNRLSLAIVLFGLLSPIAGRADDSPAPPETAAQATPKPQTTDGKAFRLPRWLQFGGGIRGRFEDPSGMSFIPDASDAYYFSRVRLNLTVRPRPWLRFI